MLRHKIEKSRTKVSYSNGKDHIYLHRKVGREWLEERGIKTFTYILVSGPKIGNPPSISVPRDQEAKFDHFFHLVLEYPELKKLLSV